MLKTDKAALSAALSIAGSIAKATSKFSILQNILIEPGTDGQLIARAGNVDMEIAAPFPAAITADFQPFTCPAQTFTDFVRNAPDSAVSIDPIRNDDSFTHVQLRSGRSRLKLPVLPADAFPKLDAGAVSQGVTLAGSLLREALSAVRQAVDTDVSRFMLCGVLLEGTDEGLNVIATDTKRLQRRVIPAAAFDEDRLPSALPRVIIGTAVVDRLIKLATEDVDITLELSEQKVRATANGVVLVGKLVDGVYPDWTRITGIECLNRISFDAAPLSEAIGRVLLATPDAGNGVTFKFADDALTLIARDLTSGEGEDSIAAEFEQAAVLGLHGKHARDALDQIDGRAEMMIGEQQYPIRLQKKGETRNFTMLMPMQPKGGYAQ